MKKILLNLFTDLSKVEVKVGRCLWIELTYEVVNQIIEKEKKIRKYEKHNRWSTRPWKRTAEGETSEECVPPVQIGFARKTSTGTLQRKATTSATRERLRSTSQKVFSCLQKYSHMVIYSVKAWNVQIVSKQKQKQINFVSHNLLEISRVFEDEDWPLFGAW